jgi:hypothetical protein
MQTGSLPPASVYSTWTESVEILSVDDEGFVDLSAATEIMLRLLDQTTKYEELRLTMTNGNITNPSPGIIQWRAEAGVMGTVFPKAYTAVLTIDINGDTVLLILGIVSVME